MTNTTTETNTLGHNVRCCCLGCSHLGYIDPSEVEVPKRRRSFSELTTVRIEKWERRPRVGDRVSHVDTGKTGTVVSVPINPSIPVDVRFDGTQGVRSHGTASLRLI